MAAKTLGAVADNVGESYCGDDATGGRTGHGGTTDAVLQVLLVIGGTTDAVLQVLLVIIEISIARAPVT